MPVNAIYTIISSSDAPAMFQIARIARLAIASPALILDVLEGLRAKDIRIAMYCAEALAKISRSKPTLLTGYETEILACLKTSNRSEVRGPLTLVVPRLALNNALKRNAIRLMFECLNDDSRVLRERVYTALTEVSTKDVSTLDKIVPLLSSRLEVADQVERAKARKLLATIALSGATGSSSRPRC